MQTFALPLALIGCLTFVCACSDSSSEDGAATKAPESTSAKAAADEGRSPASATPITIDKGDGCVVVIQEQGRGRAVRIGDEVLVDYVARVQDAEQPFASTAGCSEPCRIALGDTQGPRVVAGLMRGLDGLKIGSKATITVPPALGYGKKGLPGAGIPADATLVFDVEINGVR
jgi:FKBP-type peptidyl-prolyl cis-trans isomerase